MRSEERFIESQEASGNSLRPPKPVKVTETFQGVSEGFRELQEVSEALQGTSGTFMVVSWGTRSSAETFRGVSVGDPKTILRTPGTLLRPPGTP